MLGNLFAQPIAMSSLVYLFVWRPLPHIPYISSPNQCLLFAAHAHTIATCFAVVSILYHLFHQHLHPHISSIQLQETCNHYLSIMFLEYIPHQLLCPAMSLLIHPPFPSMNQHSRYRPEIPGLSAVYQPLGHHEHKRLP